MNDRKQILNALELIHSVCMEHEECSTCPFRDDDGPMPACMIQHTPPAEWKIKDQETTWRAFQ